MGWEALRLWGDDAARIERLSGGVANDVWSVRVHGNLAVGRLGSRSDADLAWEAQLLQHLGRNGLTVPAPIPYVTADPERMAKWRPAIDKLPGKRVALTWAGHAHHVNDMNRSIPLETLEPLLAQPGISFVGIQHELRETDGEILARHPQVTNLGTQFTDMADTAAVLSLVDLVIAVDTSVAHLAAAMGRPTWVLLPFTPDWRWTLTGARSPWYPQARLFRQPAIGDWSAVVANLRGALIDSAKS